MFVFIILGYSLFGVCNRFQTVNGQKMGSGHILKNAKPC